MFQRRINRSTREGIRIWRPPLRHWRGGRRGKAVEGKGLGLGPLSQRRICLPRKRKHWGPETTNKTLERKRMDGRGNGEGTGQRSKGTALRNAGERVRWRWEAIATEGGVG